MDRRSFVIGTAALAAAWRPDAFAQEAFPAHAITIINAFPPGGANDIVTRPLAAALEPILKQPVVIETKAGAAGQVGAQVAANAKPDGYTLLSHNTGISGYAEVDKLFGRHAEVHPRRFHSARAPDRRSVRAAGQRPAALQDAQGLHRRRQEAAGSDHLQFGRALRRHPSADGAAREGGRRPEASPSADQWRRAGASPPSSATTRRCSVSIGVGDAAAHQGRQVAAAGAVRRARARRRCPTCRR